MESGDQSWIYFGKNYTVAVFPVFCENRQNSSAKFIQQQFFLLSVKIGKLLLLLLAIFR